MLQLAVADQSTFESSQALKRAALFVDSLVLWPRDFAIAHNPDAHGDPIVTLRPDKRRLSRRLAEAFDEVAWLAEQSFVKMVDIRIRGVSIAVSLPTASAQQTIQVPEEAVGAVLKRIPAGGLNDVRNF